MSALSSLWHAGPRPITRLVVRGLTENKRLIALGLGLFVAHGLLPRGIPLARWDWIPWLVLNLSLAGFLRGAPIGLGNHPQLRRRADSPLAGSLLAGLAPWWFYVLSLLTTGDTARGGAFAALSAVGTVFMLRRHVRMKTAWNPRRGAGAWVLVALGLILLLGLAFVAGRSMPGQVACLVAGSMLSISMALGSTRNLRQRWVAWQGNPLLGVAQREITTLISLVFIPAVGLEVVQRLAVQPQIQGQGFEFSLISTIYVLVWAAIAWRRPSPSGLACILREVTPGGGRERKRQYGIGALDFREAPEGSLVLDPLKIKRQRRFHAWYVPVESGVAASAGLRSRPLWATWEPVTGHALGDARCGEDGIPRLLPTGQWDEVSIAPQGGEDRESLGVSQAGVRRQVILRPFARRLFPPLRTLPPTFVWEAGGAHSLKQLNTGRELLRIAQGDVLVLSSGGIVRCFEFDPGCELGSLHLSGPRHVPQPEDYLQVDQ